MEGIHLISTKLSGCIWRWWAQNLQTIGGSQKSIRQTGESLVAFHLVHPTKDPHFQACVVSKLLYCLHTMWPNKAELRKIDGFQAKCLHSILRIPLPYTGRILNATVLQRSRCKQLSTILIFRQLFLFESIGMLPDEDVRRRPT